MIHSKDSVIQTQIYSLIAFLKQIGNQIIIEKALTNLIQFS